MWLFRSSQRYSKKVEQDVRLSSESKAQVTTKLVVRQTLFSANRSTRATFKTCETELRTNPVTRVSNSAEKAEAGTKGLEHELDEDERATLESAGIEPAILSRETCSYRMLLEAGVDDDVATALRRRYSLPWSFESDGDLDKRSSEVRGLGEAEREWVAASSTEDWQAFDSVYSRATENEDEETVDRPWPRPTPVTAVTGISPENAARLAEAGITSAERLSTINAGEVASVLELSVLHVRTWRHNAREIVD